MRLSPAERQAIVELLNNRTNNEEGRKKRRSDRYPYLVPEGLAIELRQQQAKLGDFLISPRNISTSGIAFLHGAFVYQGSRCVIDLKARDGRIQPVTGNVVRCRSVRGRIHEIAVQFDEPIRVDEFADTQLPQELPEDALYRATDLAGLARRLLDQAYQGAPLGDVRATVLELARVVRNPHRELTHPEPTAEAVDPVAAGAP